MRRTATPALQRAWAAAGGRAERGLTVIELMIVLVLLSLVTAVAAPNLSGFLAGQRMRAATLDLTADLLLARSEALKRSATVTVTPRNSSWAAGWVVASGGTELASREALDSSVRFDDAPSSVSFNPQGRVSAPSTAVRISMSSSRDTAVHRCVELDLSGRARSKLTAC